jgi:D-psicose/D-tagatose/L-ribulose 3-epimerase
MRKLDRICVSNIAWPAQADREAVRLAADIGYAGIELAPSKTFGGWQNLDLGAAAGYRRELASLGLVVPALQGILFGRPDCTLFGSSDERSSLRRHLDQVARLAGVLGAQACVFGAPKQRDPGTLAAAEAEDTAVDFLRSVAPMFEREGSALAFEANAAIYGCRFVLHTAEALALVQKVDHPSIRLQIDTGTFLIDGDDPATLAAAVPVAAHFHASEPHMKPVGSMGSNHRALGEELRKAGYACWKSVEMATVENWRGAIREAACLMADAYGG